MKAFSKQIRILETWSLPIMILDTDLRFTYANKAYLKAVHRSFDDIDGAYVFDAFPDEDDRVNDVLTSFQATLGGKITQLSAQPFKMDLEDGTSKDVVWRATQDPVRNAEGTIIGLIQRCEDITAQYNLEKRNEAIGHELSHRVKNIMTVINSVARITGRNATSVNDYVKRFTDRIGAMSRTNDLMLDSGWRGVDIETVFEKELTPFNDKAHPVYTLNGPKILLSVDGTKNLSMVCHELATNAVKYGCLSQMGGHLDIQWLKNDDGVLIHWVEKCVQSIAPTDQVGFGTRLFDMLPHVTVTRDFTPTGLHLTITMDDENQFA